MISYFLACLAIYLLSRLFIKRDNLSLPPGPRKLPVIGNLLDYPQEKEWLTFAKWGEKYGNTCSVTVLGQPMIILNSVKVAVDMLDKRGSIYSDRPVVPMGGELVGWKYTLALTPYGDKFRSYRRMAHQVFKPSAMEEYHPIEELEMRKLLKRLLDCPEDLLQHIRQTTGAIILRISHGYDVTEGSDPFVTLADKAILHGYQATKQFAYSTTPGGFLVNLIPALRYIPAWLPGADFQHTAKDWAYTLNEMVERPFDFVKCQMAAGTAKPSYTSKLLEESVDSETEFDIKWSAASLYSGGADTTVATIYAFFKAMILYPEVQARAQAEIDSVVGSDRLPYLSDRASLQYVNAVALEVLRWHSVAPTAIAHRVSEDNIFNGYRIPKGALVVANVWYMAHDPEVYYDPMVFNPERFLGPTPELDPRGLCFGFGRRMCPGRLLADESVFMACAVALAALNISKYSKNGIDEIPNVEQTTGTISHPTPFRCSLTPRSERVGALLAAENL